jgi:hypothetical protein
VHPWRRRLSDSERSVLLSELLLRHPELAAEAEEITTTLLVVEDGQELADEITARLRALRPGGPVSVDAGRELVLDLLQPYIDNIIWRQERGACRAATDAAVALLLGLHQCRDDNDQDLLLVRLGLPGTVDELARTVYTRLRPLHLIWPSLTDECPEWQWYQERLERADRQRLKFGGGMMVRSVSASICGPAANANDHSGNVSTGRALLERQVA